MSEIGGLPLSFMERSGSPGGFGDSRPRVLRLEEVANDSVHRGRIAGHGRVPVKRGCPHWVLSGLRFQASSIV